MTYNPCDPCPITGGCLSVLKERMCDREHLAYANENGEPEECTEDCPGCHWEGNSECEALLSGCDICDPDTGAQ